MYGSLQAAGGGDAADESKTPLMSNLNRKHPQQVLPPNYDASRRMQDLKNQKAVSSRRGKFVRDGSQTVFHNVFDEAKKQSPGKKKVAFSKEIDKRLPVATPEEDEKEGEPTAEQQKQRKTHSFLYSMLNPYSRRWQATLYKNTISTIITADLLMFICSTDLRANTKYPRVFNTWEATVSYIFLIEYCARLYVVTEKTKYGDKGPVLGRLYYAFGSFGAWIDLLAASPYFVELLTGWDLPRLTILRIFRLFRILKTEGYMRAVDAVYRVIYYNSEILYVAALICVFLTVSTGMLLYVLRPEHDLENDFGSIAATLYLSTMMLTGQGGPGGELPWYTKSVVLLTSVFSVAIFAIPASMLTWGFEAEAERMAAAAYRRANKPDTDSSTSSSEGDTTDDEYFKLIAGGGDDDSEDEEEAAWMKQFRLADVNRDGTLSMQETMAMMKQRQTSPELSARIDALEAKTKENSEKLDQILNLLQNSKKKGRG